MAELTSVLYNDYDIGGKDKFILSKGHAVPIVYAILHELGRISDEDLSLFREIDSPLQGHPDKLRLSEMDATTGSLGQGLSIAIGHALGKQLRGEDGKVFCLLGDGEMQEGQVWESLMYVPKTGQNDGWSKDFSSMYDNLKDRISSFGWDCEIIDGHDTNVISTKLAVESDKPRCIILNTMKGKGVSFMEDPSWHAKVPTEEQYEQAIKELGV
jgi:transketolase